jgi:hypothetical protein
MANPVLQAVGFRHDVSGGFYEGILGLILQGQFRTAAYRGEGISDTMCDGRGHLANSGHGLRFDELLLLRLHDDACAPNDPDEHPV